MMLLGERYVEVHVDRATWPSSKPPPALATLSGLVPLSADLALLHVALRTSPPSGYGFDLADYWAWMRYSAAIKPGVMLRLREEWTDIDPHQKTVLSDDFGMGWTTMLLSEALNLREFVDTRHFLKLLPRGRLRVRGAAKNGQGKSPDFVAIDPGRQLSVIECKGTQSSRSDLSVAMARGVAQKQNVQPGSRRIAHSIVAGLFLPQAWSGETALLELRDPPDDELDHLLEHADPRDVEAALVRVAMAKGFSLLGLGEAAVVMMQGQSRGGTQLDVRSLGPRGIGYSDDRSLVVLRREWAFPDAEVGARRVNVYAACPAWYVDEIHSLLSPRALEQLADRIVGGHWVAELTETSVALQSPLGFSLKIGGDGPLQVRDSHARPVPTDRQLVRR